MFSKYFNSITLHRRVLSRTARQLWCGVSILVLAALHGLAWSQSVIPVAEQKSVAPSRVGFVNSVNGAVTIRKPNGTQAAAKTGDVIERGTVISAGASGEIVVLFPDGQHITLNSNSVLRVEEYVYDPRNASANRVVFALLEGIMRVVTGAINAANPEALRITAGDGVITVRNKDVTSFVVESDTQSGRETGSVAVIVGDLSVLRPNKTVIRLATDQFTRWQPSLSPSQALPLGAAPAYMQAMASVREAPIVQPAPQATATVGIVNSVTGVVLVRNANGSESTAKVGDVVTRGTIVSTGVGGEAVLLFPDGQHVTLNSDSTVRVEEYRYEVNDIKSSRTNLALTTGIMRVVTGAINAEHPDALRITAGDATISVRSRDATSFVVESDTKNGRETGSLAVIVGEVFVERPDKTNIIVETDKYTRWQPFLSPLEPLPVAAAPAYVQAMAAAGQSQQARESAQPTALTGVINSVFGEVMIRTTAGELVPAKPGDIVTAGSIVSTGVDGEAVLFFPDGQQLSVAGDSTLRVDEYRFDTRDSKESRATFSLTTGTMQVVTGAIHATNPDALRVTAGDAVIGVLSKDVSSFVVESETKFSREAGSLAVIAGEVSVLRPDGTTTKIDTDQFTRWRPSINPEDPKLLAKAAEDFKELVATVQARSAPDNVALDVETAVVLALASLPAAAAGTEEVAQVPTTTPVFLPPVTPGAAGGCVGSPC